MRMLPNDAVDFGRRKQPTHNDLRDNKNKVLNNQTRS